MLERSYIHAPYKTLQKKKGQLCYHKSWTQVKPFKHRNIKAKSVVIIVSKVNSTFGLKKCKGNYK